MYPWNSLGQNTGVGSLSLFRRIFPTQELNRCLLPCRWILYQLNYQRNPVYAPYNTQTLVSEVKSLSPVRLFATLWTVAHQAPPSMGFSRQEYWSGLPFPSPGDLPDPEVELRSPALQADALTSEPPGKQNLSKEERIPQHSHTTFIKSLIYQSSTMNYWGDSSLLNVLCKTAF